MCAQRREAGHYMREAGPAITRTSPEREEPLRIVMVNWRDTQHPEGGGSERYVEFVAAGLARGGHDVTVLCARYPGAAREQTRDGFRIVRRGGKLTVYLWAIWMLAARRLGRPDVVVDVQNGIPFFSRVLAGWPTVVLVHHVHREQWPVIYRPTAARFGWWVESRLAVRHYRHSRYVAVSQVTRDELVDLGVDADRIHVIHNGTSPALPSDRSPSPEPTVCVLGRLVPHKQVEHALAAAAVLRDRFPGLRLRILGDGWWRSHLVEAACRLGVEDITDFLGQVDEGTKHDELAQAWVLAAPSLKEGWGLVVVEAGQHEVPTVGYRAAGGIAESIVDGQTGLLADDSDHLTELVGALLADHDRRHRLGAAASRRAETFTWDAAVVSWERTLCHAARGRGVSPTMTAAEPITRRRTG